MRSNPEDEIVVNGWSPRFAAAVKNVLDTEGGFVDHPNDPGGATNRGISLRFLKAEGKLDLDGDGILDFDLDFDGDLDRADIRKLFKQDAKVLYFRCFWDRLKLDALPPPIGEMVFDQAVNGGRSAGVKLLQRAINACLRRGGDSAPAHIGEDGVIGLETIHAMNWVIHWRRLGTSALAMSYREAAAQRYVDLAARNPKLRVFLKGWLRRAHELGRG